MVYRKQGKIANVQHRISKTGRSVELIAVVEVKVGTLTGDPWKRQQIAEQRIEALRAEILGDDVVIFPS